MASNGVASAFLGALQASVAVLLTISYGVAATQFNILHERSAKEISKLCVKMFLPALLISNVGSQLSPANVGRYVPILIWALVYTFLSIGVGYVVTRIFKLPSWVTPAVAFNNTVSLPLVLIQSLDATGILSRIVPEGDSTSDAVLRAKSYFLVCSMVGSSLTFALGPKLLDGDDAPDEDDAADGQKSNGGNHQAQHESRDDDVEGAHGTNGGGDDDENEENDERTSLLPDAFNRRVHHVSTATQRRADTVWSKLPQWLRTVLHYLQAFLVAPMLAAITGAIIGLSPPLRKVFFNGTSEGGFFSAWLTSSVKNVGDLFAALQLVVVGCKLSGALRNMKENKESGSVPWGPMTFVFLIRFVVWPLISIPLIWALAMKTSLLGDDPMLWFCLMLMPTGPPAIRLTALADVNGSSEHEKMSIAKFLTIAYTVSPLICFSVVAALRATEAALPSGSAAAAAATISASR
ncbi:MAG: hypothetical protein M1816_003900 [Peltula sp. TS41687]|nr:MAG: hypothetical protein M1816_003900 [Peltula sp. TS41687]